MKAVKINSSHISSIMLLAPMLFSACNPASKDESKLFTLLPSGHTHIHFENQITNTRDLNILNYRNYYNGGGVGIGDVNNDGLQDIYFTANSGENKLYLNKDNFEFEDVTEKAGVAGTKKWSTGVSMVDINGDGWLDIYVCNSGVESDDRRNELFINNGDSTFTERAEEFRLADSGYSIHAAFFDYDKDGYLDVYILNNSRYPNIPAPEHFSSEKRKRTYRDKLGGDRLMHNDNGHFTDVSAETGIYGSLIGFGLNVSVSDLNKDGWPDLYISNDFFERDYVYINNGDGTFGEKLTNQMQSISLASMGADIADMSGDGYPEIFVTEMLPETDERLKTNMHFVDWDTYYDFYLKDNSYYYYQFTRNVLQLNNGVIPGKGITFSEVGRMAGVEATDWSWTTLILDLNNDGFKDIYVTNGTYHDILNKDYLNYISEPREEFFRRTDIRREVDIEKMISLMPSNLIPNYAFEGGPDLTFTRKTTEWGLDEPSFSNGAAYADLDNDGDLDLVVNNVNMPASVYRNESEVRSPQNNYLKIVLKGEGKNTLAVGAKVTLKADGKLFYMEQVPQRGFQSSVDPRLNFGLGDIEIIDTLLVDWPGGRQTLLTKVQTNQILSLKESNASGINSEQPAWSKKLLFINVTDRFPLSYRHVENDFDEFDKNPLLFHMESTEGPKTATADVNGDGLQDLFIGGAKGRPGKLFVREPGRAYRNTNQSLFEADRESEDLGCIFFDADGDTDPDLYVTSGGNEALAGSGAYADRLYFNDGKGNFTKSRQQLPTGRPENTSVVKAADIDADGDLDLFVGIRLRPGLAGIPQHGYLLQNNGRGEFRNITRKAAPGLQDLGMITDAVWSDYDGDGDTDLIVVGKWMKIRLFDNGGTGTFVEQTETAGLTHTSGWWNTIEAADIDGDGDIDFVAGNMGLNSRFRASREKPMQWHINDFDRNGTIDHIISAYNGDASYPLISRDELVNQLPYLKAKYPTHASYAGQTITDIFTEKEINGAVVHEMEMLESVLLRNNGDGTFGIEPLPRSAQVSPVYAILINDLDADGNNDILLGGNLHSVKPDIGRYDASYGTYLKGIGNGQLQAVKARDSGLALEGEIRDFALLDVHADKPKILVARNNDRVMVLEFNEQ